VLKKVGMVAVGSMAGLVALAPIASATECAPQHHDKGHHKSDHHGHGKHETKQVKNVKKVVNKSNCESGSGVGDAKNALGVQVNAPINALNCSKILSDNLSGNNINILSSGIPTLPA
jgi:hypothetical protein